MKKPDKKTLTKLYKDKVDREIAAIYGVHHSTISKWRKEYGLYKRRKISEEAKTKIRRKNHKDWIKRCIKKFKVQFDYSKTEVIFETQKSPKVPIVCTKHNYCFSQTPDKHIQSRYGGCKFCSAEIVKAERLAKDKRKFLNWFNSNLSDRLEIVSEFKGMTETLNFKCKIHKTIEPYLPTTMLTSAKYYPEKNETMGCSICTAEATSIRFRSNPDELREELEPTLPENVEIESIYFDEILRQSVLRVKCELHGLQKPWRIASFRKSPTKCIKCSAALNGYAEHKLRRLIEQNEKGRPCQLAVMDMEVFGIQAMKVGLTSRTLSARYGHYLKTVFFSVELFEIDTYVLDNRIKIKFHEFSDNRIMYKGIRNGERWGGDTEFFTYNQKDNIINFIKSFVKELEKENINYEEELGKMLIPTPLPVSVGREKGEFQGPIPVIGIDKDTHEILYDLPSYAAAEELGFDNIALIISDKYGRTSSKGVRWFQKSEFDPDNIPHIEIPNAVPVFCVERNQHFLSTIEAEKEMRELGFPVSATKISSVLNGHRKNAGGFKWKYSQLSTQEIRNQKTSDFINYRPKVASNIPKKVTLISLKDENNRKTYESQSLAAQAIGDAAANIRRALRDDKTVKGYRVEIAID